MAPSAAERNSPKAVLPERLPSSAYSRQASYGRAFEFALHFARTEHGGGGVPIIEHQAVGYALADAKMGIEAVRARNWRPRFPTVLEFSASRPARISRVSHAPLAM